MFHLQALSQVLNLWAFGANVARVIILPCQSLGKSLNSCFCKWRIGMSPSLQGYQRDEIRQHMWTCQGCLAQRKDVLEARPYCITSSAAGCPCCPWNTMVQGTHAILFQRTSGIHTNMRQTNQQCKKEFGEPASRTLLACWTFSLEFYHVPAPEKTVSAPRHKPKVL